MFTSFNKSRCGLPFGPLFKDSLDQSESFPSHGILCDGPTINHFRGLGDTIVCAKAFDPSRFPPTLCVY